MAVFNEKLGKERRTIITRFRNQEDLNDFAVHIGLPAGSLTDLTTEVILPELEVKNKKPGKKRPGVEKWRAEWKEMPYYINEKNEAFAVIKLHFDEEHYEGLEGITEVMEQSMTESTKSLWYPKWNGQGRERCLRVVGGSSETLYPVYVISKGRYDVCKTSNFLTMCEVNHYVVVEEQEYDLYMSTVGQSPFVTVLILDKKFQDEYETLYELEEGEVRKTGPGAARNFCWEHSIQNGFFAHHVIDDNSQGFHLLSDNCKFKVRTGAFIRAMEDFFNRYDNVAIVGPNYSKFALQNEKQPAFTTNTRIYSWCLIRNDIPYRWRGRYNEDTILSLDALKDGWATVQYNAFLQDKMATQTLKGGNTEEFYSEEGTLRKSQMLADVHPDVSKVVFKFSRWHHEVNYRPFANNPLKLKDGLELTDEVNDYGMKVVKIRPEDEYTYYDTKSGIEEKYGDNPVYKFDGTRWQNGFNVFKDFEEKGY